jgi:predicted transcriptional regulator
MNLDLFDYVAPGARNTDPSTSHLAAAEHRALRGKDRRDVLRLHALNPAGLTDFELASRMGRQQTSVGKRRGELRDLGLIEDSNLRRRAPSQSQAIVWKITPRGLVAAAEHSP